MSENLTKIVGIALYIPSFLYLSGPFLEQNSTIKEIADAAQKGFNEIVKTLSEQDSFSTARPLLKVFALLCSVSAIMMIVMREFAIASWLAPYLAIAFFITLICALSLAWVLFYRAMAARFIILILGVAFLALLPGPHQGFIDYQLSNICQIINDQSLICARLHSYPPPLLFALGAIFSTALLYIIMSFFSLFILFIILSAVELILIFISWLHRIFPKDTFGGVMVLLQLISGLLLAM